MTPSEGTMAGVPNPDPISTKQRRIAEVARHLAGQPLHSLSHHIDLDWMREAYRRTRKDGAVGIDGQTAEEFAEDLEGNLQALLNEFKSGTYRAPPVRRVHIPKGKGSETRPIGITTFRDKVLQRAVVMALEPVYEGVFEPFSYGFRPGRSAHQAVNDLQRRAWKRRGGVVIEVDIRRFFDEIDRGLLQRILRHRVTDGPVVRLIGKWLNAGVIEEGVWFSPEKGTPQGGVVSPLLSNIYLHEVFDAWWVREVQPRLKGRGFPFRYADDLVILCTNEEDARRVLDVLPKRFGRYGLTLHPEKTRLVPFRRPRGQRNETAGSFDFLGFTFYWGRSWNGNWIPKRKTSRSRLSRALRNINQWCRRGRHAPVADQARGLRRKLLGHYQYYGITGNVRSLGRFYQETIRIWRKWLGRRSQKGDIPWDVIYAMASRYSLPPPRVVHSPWRQTAKASS
jgi:group II intron reverse transcriptase/maturase